MESKVSHRRDIGKKGEDIACEMLEKMGHTILERNWRNGRLEIDIISSDSDGIHFIEVKTRQMNIQTPPQENVGYTKQKRIAKAAQGFLRKRKGLPAGNRDCSFDVIAVTFCDGSFRTEWFPQAFIPIYI